MKTETKKKFIVLATILVIGTIMTVAVAKLAGNNTDLKNFIFVASTVLAGHVIATPKGGSMWPKGIKNRIGLIAAVLLISTLFWALECFIF